MMAEFRADHEIVTTFLLKTCRLHRSLTMELTKSTVDRAALANKHVLFGSEVQQGWTWREDLSELTWHKSSDTDEINYIPLTTGSVAEFYIQPMLSCVGDVDIMVQRSDELAIPTGTAPPTQLPGEFHSRVKVYEIVDCEFSGYVYLALSYLLTECTDDGKYNVIECERRHILYKIDEKWHGPALVSSISSRRHSQYECERLVGMNFSRDTVLCVRCLSWPTQAADWPTRHRNYDWPNSATVDRVVSIGFDVVRVTHKRHRGHLWNMQHRLSFSRAEVLLLNSWMPVQQIVYHMLRVFVKIERLTESADNSDAATLSNYHIKTLMLWACELKPRSWWTDDLNLVRLCVELLHTLGDWLSDVHCPHYFIHNCNLLTYPDDWCCSLMQVASRLMSETDASLAEWFIDNYLRKCAQLCPDLDSLFVDEDKNRRKLQTLIFQLDHCTLDMLPKMASQLSYLVFHFSIVNSISHQSLTVRSCLCWMQDLLKIDHCFYAYFTAVTFLHVGYKTTSDPLNDRLLDVLATICLQSNDIRRCRKAQHSSVLSLSQATKLMKVVVNSSRSTVQLIEIELSKAYLYRALRCKDSDSDSIYCLANVYLAVMYYITGQYQTAIDHCTLVTRSQDHSQYSSRVVQGELLPKIDDDIDTVSGLSVFYHYVRTAALNPQQQTQHVSVFTTELFAYYLHIRCLSFKNCRQLTRTSADPVQRYRKCLSELRTISTTDLLLANLVNRTKHSTSDQREVAIMPEMSHQLDTSKLVQLLQQSAFEHLTTFRQLEEEKYSSAFAIVATDFEAVYAYRHGDYQQCALLCLHNVCTLIRSMGIPSIFVYPEFIQLMDDDIVSLFGLMMIVNPSCRDDDQHDQLDKLLRVSVHQLFLSLYLMTQCQLKLHHPVKLLARTLDFIDLARRRTPKSFTLDLLLLKLTERKILLHVNERLQ